MYPFIHVLCHGDIYLPKLIYFYFFFLHSFLLYNGNEGAVTASAPIDDQWRGPILTIELIKTEIHLVLFNDFCYYFSFSLLHCISSSTEDEILYVVQIEICTA